MIQAEMKKDLNIQSKFVIRMLNFLCRILIFSECRRVISERERDEKNRIFSNM